MRELSPCEIKKIVRENKSKNIKYLIMVLMIYTIAILGTVHLTIWLAPIVFSK
jgi:hypothetical protein